MDNVPGVLEVETAALTAWPGLFTAHDGLWVCRLARGYSNRANSIHCLDPGDGADAGNRIARCTELFVRHGLTPAFKVSPLLAPEVTEALDGLGWEPYEPSRVLRLVMGTQHWEPRRHTALFAPADPQWHTAQAKMSGYSPYAAESVRLILERIACDSRGVLAYAEDGVAAAAALAAVANGIAIFGNVVTAPAHRGKGFGRAAMDAALRWARATGAQAAAIQVAAGNAPANALYRSLGFGEGYDYCYRRPRVGP
jgi:GNAT superfamily N-acetyltransferase